MLAASFDGELFLLASLSGCQAVSEFGGDHESCSRSGLISFSASDVTMAHLRITSPAYLRGFAPKTASDVIKWGATVTSPSPLRSGTGALRSPTDYCWRARAWGVGR